MLGFSTANRFPLKTEGQEPLLTLRQIREEELNAPFEAVAEATEEAVLNSLSMAHTVTGYGGHTRYCLTDLYPDLAF